jgi:hypothetical protein
MKIILTGVLVMKLVMTSPTLLKTKQDSIDFKYKQVEELLKLPVDSMIKILDRK